jgi:hypothetical protein
MTYKPACGANCCHVTCGYASTNPKWADCECREVAHEVLAIVYAAIP